MRITAKRLADLYLRRKLSCPRIGKLIGVRAETIHDWLVKCGIPRRPRGTDPASRKGWSNLEVSHRTGRKLSRATKEKIRAARLRDKRAPYLVDGKHWLHVYGKTKHPRWKGGITAERQKCYASPEWKQVVQQVWKRDKRTCQRCGEKHRRGGMAFDVHHIVSFEACHLRCVLSNLVLLCEPCHYWVHGPKNKQGRFLKPCP